MDEIALGRTAPKFREEASRSWWLDKETREAFDHAVADEEARMRRSRAALLVRGVTIGWYVSGAKP